MDGIRFWKQERCRFPTICPVSLHNPHKIPSLLGASGRSTRWTLLQGGLGDNASGVIRNFTTRCHASVMRLGGGRCAPASFRYTLHSTPPLPFPLADHRPKLAINPSKVDSVAAHAL